MKMQATIFNIQKFSLHDGPGIRTVVFFKGCPLRCKWCSNPESQSPKPQLMDGEMKGCLMTVEEVVDVCMQDIDFYLESGGGVTLSGGEALVYPDFAVELLRNLYEKGVHTAIETTGYARADIFEKVVCHLDLLLFDVKHYDDARHFEGTGVHNKRILENLQYAIRQGMKVLPRIPIIPGFNSSLADAQGFSELLNRVGAKRAQLLPFHQFGEKKYEMLHRDYQLSKCRALHPEELEDYKNVLLKNRIDCFF